MSLWYYNTKFCPCRFPLLRVLSVCRYPKFISIKIMVVKFQLNSYWYTCINSSAGFFSYLLILLLFLYNRTIYKLLITYYWLNSWYTVPLFLFSFAESFDWTIVLNDSSFQVCIIFSFAGCYWSFCLFLKLSLRRD